MKRTEAARTEAAVQSRREYAAQLVARVDRSIREMRRRKLPVSARGVAAYAGVSRTFLYENTEARALVRAATGNKAPTAAARTSKTEMPDVDSGWRERTLNAEAALKAADTEIQRHRQRIGELMGQIRDLEQAWSPDGQQRLVSENTTLRQRLRQREEDVATLTERLTAARSNNRFLDRRIADLETQLLDRTDPPTQTRG